MSTLSSLRVMPVLLLLLLVVLTCSPSHVLAQIRPGCVNKYKCPTRESKLCGIFYNCMPGSLADPKKASVTTCNSCSFNEPKKAFASTCNFQYGRCVANTIDGKVCTLPRDCFAPGVTGFECSAVKGKKDLKRCCSKKCPAGMCGAGARGLKYTNACGEQITCPGVCPKAI